MAEVKADDGWRLGHRRGLDQLRGLAVLIVLIGHGAAETVLDKAGAVGVIVFFVLSGFLITRLLIEERVRTGRIDLRRFYIRRARRLLPALPLALTLCAMANLVMGGHPILRPAIATSTYTVNFAGEVGAFSHLWSLAVEEHFYLVWPLVMLVLPLRAVPWVASAGVVSSVVARMTIPDTVIEAYRWTPYRVDAILLGALLAFAVARTATPRRSTMWAAAIVAAVFAAPSAWDVMLAWGMTAVAVASVVLVCGALTVAKARPLLERLGVISYGAYLYHYPLRGIVFDAAGAPWWFTLPVVLIGSIALAEVSMRTIEGRFRSKPIEITARTCQPGTTPRPLVPSL